ncbi:winged helix-turn-helix domain-containing protein [Salinarimonas ramus]|uniref:OmpR/PhoB-type domain-containing protein n=1 Tax=Salinarimonas ramus TaxID=690164 RepID=A0A917QLW0_9HYPH|nr:winged helix-turn-helix domain-containing protein [Salinarimonas ramus]GGK55550.1 hypothetical protein GCM10011322_47710 [Salinarimonas ramus]
MGGAIGIDVAERVVTLDGRPILLRAKTFDVLALLASRPGHLFFTEVLLDRVWQGRSVSAGVLSGCIHEIRRALDDDAQSPRVIETVSRAGYRLLAPVAKSGAEPRTVEPARSEQPDLVPASGAPAVAVLPPVASGRLPDTIARALGRDVAVGLARTRWLQVAAPASAERVVHGAGRGQAARALGVRYVAAVEAEIEASERRRALLSPVRAVDAWIGFHRGMSLLQRQDAATLKPAEEALRAAARSDPACARVAAALSWHSWQLSFFGVAQDRDRAVARARDLAGESITLDPRDPLGYWALGRAQWLASDMEGAAESLGRAVGLNPSFAVGHYALGLRSTCWGRSALGSRISTPRCGSARSIRWPSPSTSTRRTSTASPAISPKRAGMPSSRPTTPTSTPLGWPWRPGSTSFAATTGRRSA